MDFVNVIAQLREWKCDVKGLVVGGGPLEGAICDEIRSRGLENTIQMVGFRRDVLPLLRRMDLFLFTSHREGLSVAVLEAMAVGLPIVATDVGGIREQVEEGRKRFSGVGRRLRTFGQTLPPPRGGSGLVEKLRPGVALYGGGSLQRGSYV